jgi:hypothetical protein
MKKIFSFVLILMAIVANIDAQQLLSPSFSYSHKKASYVTLMDGKEIKGILDDIDRNKGLIEFIRIVDEAGQKLKLKAEDVKFMYLLPSGMDNLSKQADFLTDIKKWNDEKLDQDLLNQGYVYFESTQVIIRKSATTLLMQLLNPTFSKEVKIYHDPLANETASVGVAGVKVAGGDDKSYYIKIGDDVAYRLEKKNYAEEFKGLWGKCDEVIKKYTEIKWSELIKHVTDYTDCNK